VRLVGALDPKMLRGTRQRAIGALFDSATELSIEEIEARIPGAKTAIKALAGRGVIEIVESLNGKPPESGSLEPTEEQRVAIHAIGPAIAAPRFETFLLWGVTASGKTEVYLQLAAEAIGVGRQVLVMVPEIALADQVVKSFRGRFGAMVAVVHSAQNVAERWASWRAALSGHARIMIGPRSAIFAPMRDIGLIVVDEEHDTAYKQEEGIRYNARDLAVALGRFSRCPVVLGSATPSAESAHFKLHSRIARSGLLGLPSLRAVRESFRSA
jgi:primosomal protein N' (replication factor Y)